MRSRQKREILRDKIAATMTRIAAIKSKGRAAMTGGDAARGKDATARDAAGSLMDCPFCAEVVKDEAIVCKHCGRDLRIVAPLLVEVQELTGELDVLQRQLDRANARLVMLEAPVRLFCCT